MKLSANSLIQDLKCLDNMRELLSPQKYLHISRIYCKESPSGVRRICCIHFDVMNNRRNNKDAGRLLYKYMYLSLYCKGSKRLIKVCVWEGAGDRTKTVTFWPPLLWPSTLCLSRSPDAQPEALGPTLLGDGFLYCILSASSLYPNSSGPRGPFGLMWLSLPHLVYNSVSSSNCNSTRTVSWLCYIIVQCPLDRPLDLWNRMFDRHQAEITDMQFTGHSLPVRQSMSVPWEFFTLSHFISQFPPTRFPLITPIRMCHFLPVHHLAMAFLAGLKVKIQQIHITPSWMRFRYLTDCIIGKWRNGRR